MGESEFYALFERARRNGDYLIILDKWLSVFPPEQLYVGFFEQIADCPHKLLGEVFAFLGVSQGVDWSSLPYNQAINKGPAIPIPKKYRDFLEEMYCRDIEVLYERFGGPIVGWRCL